MGPYSMWRHACRHILLLWWNLEAGNIFDQGIRIAYVATTTYPDESKANTDRFHRALCVAYLVAVVYPCLACQEIPPYAVLQTGASRSFHLKHAAADMSTVHSDQPLR